MELFSEVYGCYYTVVTRLLGQAENGMTKAQIERFVADGAFYDSAFHLLPSLFSGEWRLMYEKGNLYCPRLSEKPERPLTTLEKAWLKVFLNDARIRLFLEQKQIETLQSALDDVPALYRQEDFHVFDRHLDGDDYTDGAYIERFRVIAKAVKEHMPLIVEYDAGAGGRSKRLYLPYKLSYSARDDKFRLLCAAYCSDKKTLRRVVLNLMRITAVRPSDDPPCAADLEALFREAVCKGPAVIEISRERNALERCMLQFASFERQTEYDRVRGVYICRLWYDPADETELLIRILSFGPAVKVTAPESLYREMKKRVARQRAFNEQI